MKQEQRRARQQEHLDALRERVEVQLEQVRSSVEQQVGWAPRAGWAILALLGAAAGFALARRLRDGGRDALPPG